VSTNTYRDCCWSNAAAAAAVVVVAAAADDDEMDRHIRVAQDRSNSSDRSTVDQRERHVFDHVSIDSDQFEEHVDMELDEHSFIVNIIPY
jgi:hypothetical protein